MEEDIEGKPKMNIVVGIGGTIVFALFDLISVIPAAADVLEVPSGVIFLVGIVTGLGPQFVIAEAAADFIKLFPVAQWIPTWTAAWLYTWYVTNHPSKITSAVEVAVKAEQGNLSLNDASRFSEAADQGQLGEAAAISQDYGSASGRSTFYESGTPTPAYKEGSLDETNAAPGEGGLSEALDSDVLATEEEQSVFKREFNEQFEDIPDFFSPSAAEEEDVPAEDARKVYDISLKRPSREVEHGDGSDARAA